MPTLVWSLIDIRKHWYQYQIIWRKFPEVTWLAFEQSEKEVTDLQQRTREGLKTAKDNGKALGRKEGTKVTTKKSIEMKNEIQKYSKDFNGVLNDIDRKSVV